MRPALLSLTLAFAACGRTEPVRYSYDAGEELTTRLPDGGLPCTDGRLALLPARPVVMLVVDRSSSMNNTFPGTGSSKWNALRAALRQALPPWNEELELGLHFFPATNLASCGVNTAPEQPPTIQNVNAILSRLDATNPGGSTPTALGVETAGASLVSLRTASSAKALVLATDGAPDCNPMLDPSTCTCVGGSSNCVSTRCLDDTRTLDRITTVASSGIPTWVIGLRSSSDAVFVDTLNRMAIAGGKPQAGTQKFFSASSQAELEAALTEIRRQVGTCHFLTSSVPDVGGTAELRIEDQFVPFDEAGVEGWNWVDVGNGEIALHGTACARAQQVALEQIQMVVACSQP